jgi:hypothetical protein
MDRQDRESTLRRYLLGTLAEDAAQRLEQEFLRDEDVCTELLALEDELHHEYARGGLDAAERERFAARYLTTTEGRQKVAQARALAAALGGTRARAARWPLRPMLLVAASVVLALGALVSSARRERMRVTVTDASPLPAPSAGAASPEAIPRVVTLALGSAVTRGDTSARRIELAPEVERLRLLIARPAAAPAAGRYRVVIVSAEGRELWAGPAETDADEVAVEVPARGLPEGDYEVVLRAQEGNEELASSAFTVLRTRSP